MIASYRDSGDVSEERLVAELSANGTGAAHKRLGFLVEQLWPHAKRLLGVALEGRSADISAETPSAAPDYVVRTVTENSRTLKFTSQAPSATSSGQSCDEVKAPALSFSAPPPS
jgi:hypothetical protein